MKKIKHLLTSVLLLAFCAVFAQVQIDKQLQLTGSGTDAEITGVQTVANGTDAANASSIQQGALIYAAEGGTANAYAVTLAPTVTAYTTGMVVNFKAANANTGASTLAVNGLAPQTIKKQVTTDLAANDILANQSVSVIYDGTNFQMLSLLGNAGGAAHSIGDLYGGGMIVAVWDSGGAQHGLIMDTAGDLSTNAVWSSQSGYEGIVNQSNGRANTAAMIANGDVSGAGYICHHYSGGSYTDWYLPAIWELQQCWNAAETVNNILGEVKGLTLYNYGYAYYANYWSSTEAGNQGLTQSNLGASGSSKSNPNSVRAVRRF